MFGHLVAGQSRRTTKQESALGSEASLTFRGSSEAFRSFYKLRTPGLASQPLSGVGFAQAPRVILIQILQ